MLSPGDIVKDCEVIAPLGSGGMARLYLARRRGVGGFSRLVTLKLVHPHLIGDENIVKLFLDEARISAHVAHPNVVHVEEVGKFGGSYFIAMEYVHGVSLAELLTRLTERRLRLRPKLCVWLAAQIAEALHAAHEAKGENGDPLGIVHRDVSPQNVLIGHTGHVKLIDFGIARSRSTAHRSGGRAVLGKIRYMSPEQLRLERADRRTDVYALGVMLWEMLAGRRLTRCQRLDDENDWLIRENPPPPSKYSAHSTPSLDRVVLKAIAYEASERYDSAFQFRAALLRADPEAVTLDAPMVAALMRSMLGDELDRRRASWPSEVSGELDDKSAGSQKWSLEELTAENLGLYPVLALDASEDGGLRSDEHENVLADAHAGAYDDDDDADVDDADADGEVSDDEDDYADLDDDRDEDAEPTVAIRSVKPRPATLDDGVPMIASSYADLMLAAASTTSMTEPMIASVRADLMLALATASVSYDPREGLRVENPDVMVPSHIVTEAGVQTTVDLPAVIADASYVQGTAIDTLNCPPLSVRPPESLPNALAARAATIGSACLVLGVFLGTLLSRSPQPETAPNHASDASPAAATTEHDNPLDTFKLPSQPTAAPQAIDPTPTESASMAAQDCALMAHLDTKILAATHRDGLSSPALSGECERRQDVELARSSRATRREARLYNSRRSVSHAGRHAGQPSWSSKRLANRKSK